MRPISSSEIAPLSFNEKGGSQKITAQNQKIAWLRSLTDQPVKFDITIKDGLGRPVFTRKDFGTETTESGELINIPTMMGEELEISVSNVRGAKKLDLFLN